MASSNKVFVSPGVYTSERDLTFVAQSVGVTTLGVVGETLQGPAFEPIFITNFDEFQVYFGGTSPEKFVNTQIPKYELGYITKAYLQQSNQLFVTRVLGLSGYDAGPSWSITTIANVNPATIAATGSTGPFYVLFTGTTGTSANVTLNSVDASLNVNSNFYNTYTQYDGGTSTINDDLKIYLSNQINLAGTAGTGKTSTFWGIVSGGTYNLITSGSVNTVTAVTENFGVTAASGGTLNSSTNDAWFYGLFNYQNATTNSYYGQGFGCSLGSLAGVSGGYSGSAKFYITNYSGTPYTAYDELVVATLRSRGITTYSSTQHGPSYEVTGVTDVDMICTGAYSAVTKNPFLPFSISGVSNDGEVFEFETSMQSSDKNFIRKVFGGSNFGKNRTEVPLFVEETYSSLLLSGYRAGQIRGLSCDLIALPDAQQQINTDSIGFYLEQYQTPETPYMVSELRGNTVYKLFKFVLISDGNNANTQVKMSIGNISFNNGTFDVFIRDFFDNDQLFAIFIAEIKRLRHDIVAAEAAATKSGLPLSVIRDTSAAASKAYGATLVLVRPDAFVAWAGEGADAPAEQVMSRVRGAVPIA